MEEVAGFACSAAGFGTAGEVGEGEPLVLLQGGVAKVFSAEEEKRVEQHDGGVGAQLLALPQVGLRHAGRDHPACKETEEHHRAEDSNTGVIA